MHAVRSWEANVISWASPVFQCGAGIVQLLIYEHGDPFIFDNEFGTDERYGTYTHGRQDGFDVLHIPNEFLSDGLGDYGRNLTDAVRGLFFPVLGEARADGALGEHPIMQY